MWPKGAMSPCALRLGLRRSRWEECLRSRCACPAPRACSLGQTGPQGPHRMRCLRLSSDAKHQGRPDGRGSPRSSHPRVTLGTAAISQPCDPGRQQGRRRKRGAAAERGKQGKREAGTQEAGEGSGSPPMGASAAQTSASSRRVQVWEDCRAGEGTGTHRRPQRGGAALSPRVTPARLRRRGRTRSAVKTPRGAEASSEEASATQTDSGAEHRTSAELIRKEVLQNVSYLCL